MDRADRLKKSKEFKFVYNNGRVFSNNLLVLYVVKNNSDNNKVGVSVSKKVGKSVVRNKVRRKIKECYRLNKHLINKGYNIVFISRVKAKDAAYIQIENAMMSLFKKAQLLIIEGWIMRYIFMYIIKLYQKFISPMKPPSCRFYPTCSQYAVESLSKYGVFKGGYLAFKRLMRCHPFHPGGYDPVP